MIVSSSKYLPLVATNSKGRITSIPCKLIRKPMTIKEQTKIITDPSLLITCNYIFKDKKFDWIHNVKAVGHPYKKVDTFPEWMKLYLLSESDFTDKINTSTVSGKGKRSWDFIYFTINSLQGVHCKGMHLLPFIDKAAKKLKLNGLIINYGPTPEKKPSKLTHQHVLDEIRQYMGNMYLTVKNNILNDAEMCSVIQSSKFVLFPNTKDSSPRMIPETLVRDVPVLVNSSIYGGWKYVNEQTGMFFNAPTLEEYCNKKFNENELIDHICSCMDSMMNTKFDKVSEFYYEQFGFTKSATRLASIINEFSGTDYKMACYKEWKEMLN